MRSLTVLYDARCGLCSTVRRWLEKQTQIVPLEMLAAGSQAARDRFPTLAAAAPEELIVVSDDGGVYRGPHAWILCLWALDESRDWSFRFARPSMLPRARAIVEWISTRRHGLSKSLGMMSDEVIAFSAGPAAAGSERCDLPAGTRAR